MGLSVIIPVGKKDSSWKNLLPDLLTLDLNDEIILVSAEDKETEFSEEVSRIGLETPSYWLQSNPGRAQQLNLGAQFAKKEFLWFLHCDSRISPDGIKNLRNFILSEIDQILFFNLEFLNDGPRLTIINEIGAWIRSRILKLPFGDQGICVPKRIFYDLGKYDESVSFGEDHLFIWRAHQKHISIKCVGGGLRTSARKYSSQGWSETTATHLSLTFQQALPELIQFFRMKWFS